MTRSKLTPKDIKDIQTRFWAGEKRRDIARAYGLSTGYVSQLAQRSDVSEAQRQRRRALATAAGLEGAREAARLRRLARGYQGEDIHADVLGILDEVASGVLTTQEIADSYRVPVATVHEIANGSRSGHE